MECNGENYYLKNWIDHNDEILVCDSWMNCKDRV